MEIELRTNNEQTELVFSGELTVVNINEIKDKLIESLCAENTIILNHNNVTEIDISYLQLLKSFCFTAQKKELEVVISDNDSDSLKKFLEIAGVHNFKFGEMTEV